MLQKRLDIAFLRGGVDVERARVEQKRRAIRAAGLGGAGVGGDLPGAHEPVVGRHVGVEILELGDGVVVGARAHVANCELGARGKDLLAREQHDEQADARRLHRARHLHGPAACRCVLARIRIVLMRSRRARREREQGREPDDERELGGVVSRVRAQLQRLVPHVEDGESDDEERERAALDNRVCVGVQGSLERERRDAEQKREPHAPRVGRLGYEPKPRRVQRDEHECERADADDAGACHAVCARAPGVAEERAAAHERRRRDDERGRGLRHGDAGDRADGEEARQVDGVDGDGARPHKRRQAGARPLPAEERQKRGEEEHRGSSHGKQHGRRVPQRRANALAAHLIAQADKLVSEVEHREEAHDVAGVPIEEDGARRAREEKRAPAPGDEAMHAQTDDRQHDHAIEPHDVARVTGDVGRKAVRAGEHHAEHLRPRAAVCDVGAEAPAQVHERGDRAQRDLNKVKHAEEIRHVLRRPEGGEQVERA